MRVSLEIREKGYLGGILNEDEKMGKAMKVKGLVIDQREVEKHVVGSLKTLGAGKASGLDAIGVDC